MGQKVKVSMSDMLALRAMPNGSEYDHLRNDHRGVSYWRNRYTGEMVSVVGARIKQERPDKRYKPQERPAVARPEAIPVEEAQNMTVEEIIALKTRGKAKPDAGQEPAQVVQPAEREGEALSEPVPQRRAGRRKKSGGSGAHPSTDSADSTPE